MATVDKLFRPNYAGDQISPRGRNDRGAIEITERALEMTGKRPESGVLKLGTGLYLYDEF